MEGSNIAELQTLPPQLGSKVYIRSDEEVERFLRIVINHNTEARNIKIHNALMISATLANLNM